MTPSELAVHYLSSSSFTCIYDLKKVETSSTSAIYYRRHSQSLTISLSHVLVVCMYIHVILDTRYSYDDLVIGAPMNTDYNTLSVEAGSIYVFLNNGVSSYLRQ